VVRKKPENLILFLLMEMSAEDSRALDGWEGIGEGYKCKCVSPVGPGVRLGGGALCLGGGVTEGEDERLGVQFGHFFADSLGERSTLSTEE
jgi:hypothetical protein